MDCLNNNTNTNTNKTTAAHHSNINTHNNQNRNSNSNSNSTDDSKDGAVIATADDAILAKLSTTQYGYYRDPFLSHMAQHASGLTSSISTSTFSTAVPLSPSLPNSSSQSAAHARLNHYLSHNHNHNNHNKHHDNVSNTRRSSQHHSHPYSQHYSPPSSPRYFRNSPPSSPPPPLRHQHRQYQYRQYQHPIIRKGTHARVCSMDRCIAKFLSFSFSSSSPSSHSKKQVVILGAGKDTAYLRYQANFLNTDIFSMETNDDNDNDNNNDNNTTDADEVQWYEIDHPAVIQNKAHLLNSMPSSLKEPQNENENENKTKHLSSSLLHLVPYDLRSPPSHLFQQLIQKFSFSLNVPTLFVMECVQMYLPETSSRELLQTITQKCQIPFLCIYDPLASNHSPFGKTMQRNLIASKAITSHSSMIQNTTLEQNLQKLLDCGFHMAVGCHMMDAYETVLTNEQRRNANRCEMLDEIEEWQLIMRHYCLIVAGGYQMDAHSDHEKSPREEKNDYSGAIGKQFVESFCQIGPDSPIGFMAGKCTFLKKA